MCCDSCDASQLTVAEELADLDGGTVRTEKDEDLASLTIQDPEARIRQFKGKTSCSVTYLSLSLSCMEVINLCY